MLHRMGLLQSFVIVVLSAELVLTSPLMDGNHGDNKCKLCPAGSYRKSSTECESCPTGSYTTDLNCESTCLPCYMDCKTDVHMKVIQNCTRTTNVKCVCEHGFKCIVFVPYSENCRTCAKIPTAKTEVAAVASGKDKHTPSSASPGNSNTSHKPCQSPKCSHQSVPPAGNATQPEGGDVETNDELAAILCPLVAVGCASLGVLLFVCRTGDETCFKRAVIKVCNLGRTDASHKSNDSTHHIPRDSFSAKQQPPFLPAANLGPVHVHNPGTVIFSLLSQFTGQVGPTVECVKKAEGVTGEEEEEDDERYCPVFHPTSSPSPHLPEEERRGETERVFFPSQEQGKDFHMSKEEEL
ncbi:uncharacterized protein si:dkey-260g12.1 isoform X1 [Pungitius pungitius]|uniref:uncharacterized protein si:dkey-260g12.1 isoform X1 n=2 Tax=Pungitius pungitius TaxID=134920 RepID=UPI00188740B7|nr:uncharacterized protein si:dkey-260g12.1 isoform X1 [Pungitius pungitius]